MKTHIINGQVYINGKFEPTTLTLEDGIITNISDDKPNDGTIIDATGKIVVPGFIDVHVHLREPGFTHKETVASGSRAAAAGGFTQICAMPNTNPVIDNAGTLAALNEVIAETAVVKVHSYAAITQGLTSEQLADFSALKAAGAFAFTNDGVGVQTSDVMYRAMIEAARLDMAVVAHCEDDSLKNSGSVHEGDVSIRLGVNGIPNICESVQIARDVLLAEAANCHYHVCHVSTKESVRVIRDAKRAGISVTAEVTPHHLLMNEDNIVSLNTNFKMNPPLRSKVDQEALIAGLLDGTIDMIATDHAPHHADEKAQSISKAPFGIIGLEHAFALLYTNMVETSIFTLEQLIDWLTKKPASVFQMEAGAIQLGSPADVTIIDLAAQDTVAAPFVSLASNTPFMGWDVVSRIEKTFVDGKIVYEAEEARV